MSLLSDCRNILNSLTSYFKKKGYTNEDIIGGFDEASEFITKVKLPNGTKEIVFKAIEDKKKEIGK